MSLAEELREAWNSHDPQKIARFYTDDGVREEFILPHARVQGREAIAAHVNMYLQAVPDSSLTFRKVVSAADTTTIEWTFTGTHTADAEGWPARGEQLVLPGVSVLDLSDGLIREERVYADFAVMLAGAGLIPGVETRTSW
jgi:steroid delta-isomerase-like uncharacterized protein